MGMGQIQDDNFPDTSTSWPMRTAFGNSGPMLPDPPRKLRLPGGGAIMLRLPIRPFKAPVCCGEKSKRIGRNMYRCQGSGHERIWPERWHHRALPWLFPF
jgi:hypothetical protein